MFHISLQEYILSWLGAHSIHLVLLFALFCILTLLQKKAKNSSEAFDFSSQGHLVKNLNDYLAIKKPDYAIMLVGKWGVGKTFFIRKFFKQRHSFFSLNSPVFVSLYGIKGQDEIDKEILKSALPAFLLLLIVFSVVLLLVSLLFYALWTSITQGSRVEFLTFIGPILLFIAVVLYKEAKILLFEIILFRRSIVFDDFERSKMLPSDLLAYINRFVEHMHKHVIIVCDKTGISDEKFAKMQEKVIGQKLVFSQDTLNAMKHLLTLGEFPLLNTLLLSCFDWIWFKNNSTPQGLHVNLRVWLFCCRRFEKVFKNINIGLLTDKKIWSSLIPEFFALTYSLQIHDYGNGRILDKNSAKVLFHPFPIGQMPDGLKKLFPGAATTESALPQKEWNAIIDNQYPLIKDIEIYWNFLIKGSCELYDQLHFYYRKTDEENKKNWKILKKSYREKSITNPGEIISIFTSVSHMVHNKCCPDTNLTLEQVSRLAIDYIQDLAFSDNCKHEYELDTEERNYLHYELDFCKDQYVAFREKLLKKIEEFQCAAITENFDQLLVLLKSEEKEFYNIWYREGFRQRRLFSGQDAKRLFDTLIVLSPSALFDHTNSIMECFRNKLSYSDGDIKFWKQFVIIANTELAKETNTIDCSKKLSISDLCNEVQRAVADSKAEEK